MFVDLHTSAPGSYMTDDDVINKFELEFIESENHYTFRINGEQ